MPELIALRRGERIFDRDGLGTRRFNEYIETLTSTVTSNDASSEEVSEVAGQINKAASEIENLRVEIRSIQEAERIINLQPLIDRINKLEMQADRVISLQPILSRLDAIEAQL